jgi:hypothetical protein
MFASSKFKMLCLLFYMLYNISSKVLNTIKVSRIMLVLNNTENYKYLICSIYIDLNWCGDGGK